MAGISTFDQVDDFFFLNGLNRAAYKAYNACLTWPRYFISSQARPVVDNLIINQYNAASDIRTSSSVTIANNVITVTMSGNDVLFCDGMSVVISGLTATFVSSPNGTFSVSNVNGNVFTYEVSNPYIVNTSTIGAITGTATVTPVTIPEIASFNRIWGAEPFGLLSTVEYNFYTQSDGARLISNTSDISSAWVGYKKVWDGPYTDQSTTIPSEFYDYIIYSCLADFYRADGQLDKSITVDSMAKSILDQEMNKPENQRNINISLRGMSSHSSRQSRY